VLPLARETLLRAKCVDGLCKLCPSNCNRECADADEFDFLAEEGQDVFRIKTIAPGGRSSHLSVVDEGMLGCEPREIVMKLTDGLFVLTTL
jgi:hypothetical protein